MAVTAGNILKVVAKQKFSNVDDHVNVLHFQVVTPPSPNDDESLLQDISEHISQGFHEFEAHVNVSVTPTVIEVYNLTQDRPVGVTPWDNMYTGGTSSGDMLPPDDALLVLLNTGVKRRQGRIYLSGLSETNQSGGQWIELARGDAETLAQMWLVPAALTNGYDGVLVVWSKTDGEAYPITSPRAMPVVADMPSRKAGRGS